MIYVTTMLIYKTKRDKCIIESYKYSSFFLAKSKLEKKKVKDKKIPPPAPSPLTPPPPPSPLPFPSLHIS